MGGSDAAFAAARRSRAWPRTRAGRRELRFGRTCAAPPRPGGRPKRGRRWPARNTSSARGLDVAGHERRPPGQRRGVGLGLVAQGAAHAHERGAAPARVGAGGGQLEVREARRGRRSVEQRRRDVGVNTGLEEGRAGDHRLARVARERRRGRQSRLLLLGRVGRGRPAAVSHSIALRPATRRRHRTSGSPPGPPLRGRPLPSEAYVLRGSEQPCPRAQRLHEGKRVARCLRVPRGARPCHAGERAGDAEVPARRRVARGGGAVPSGADAGAASVPSAASASWRSAPADLGREPLEGEGAPIGPGVPFGLSARRQLRRDLGSGVLRAVGPAPAPGPRSRVLPFGLSARRQLRRDLRPRRALGALDRAAPAVDRVDLHTAVGPGQKGGRRVRCLVGGGLGLGHRGLAIACPPLAKGGLEVQRGGGSGSIVAPAAPSRPPSRRRRRHPRRPSRSASMVAARGSAASRSTSPWSRSRAASGVAGVERACGDDERQAPGERGVALEEPRAPRRRCAPGLVRPACRHPRGWNASMTFASHAPRGSAPEVAQGARRAVGVAAGVARAQQLDRTSDTASPSPPLVASRRLVASSYPGGVARDPGESARARPMVAGAAAEHPRLAQRGLGSGHVGGAHGPDVEPRAGSARPRASSVAR